MRFKFCGDLDCPDWVLAEINILSRLTSVKMKLFVTQVIKGILGEEVDYAKVEKITSDAKFDIGDIKASIAGLQFIISSAAKHDVDGDTLSDELQQLGLPKEHATSLCKTYESKSSAIHDELLLKSLRRSAHFKDIDWKINPIVGNNERTIDVRIVLEDPHTTKKEVIEFVSTESKFKVLLHEMKVLQTQMQQIDI